MYLHHGDDCANNYICIFGSMKHLEQHTKHENSPWFHGCGACDGADATAIVSAVEQRENKKLHAQT